MKNRIAERRAELDMTQEDLADAIGVQRSTISRYDNEKLEKIPYSHANKLAEALRCSTEYLFFEEEDGIDTEYFPAKEMLEMGMELCKRFMLMSHEEQEALLMIVRAMT